MDLGGLFANASNFARASDMMKDKITLLVPCVVNGAFACELYIKGLLALQGDVITGHDLTKLFGKLSACAREDLKNSVGQKFTNSKDAFESYLNGIANAFKDWRYLYEGQSTSIDSIDNETGIVNASIVFSNKSRVNPEFLEIFISCLHDLSSKLIDEHRALICNDENS